MSKRQAFQRRSKGNNNHHREDVVVVQKDGGAEGTFQSGEGNKQGAQPVTQPSPADILADPIQESSFVDVSSILNTGKNALRKGEQKPGSNIEKKSGWIEM